MFGISCVWGRLGWGMILVQTQVLDWEVAVQVSVKFTKSCERNEHV